MNVAYRNILAAGWLLVLSACSILNSPMPSPAPVSESSPTSKTTTNTNATNISANQASISANQYQVQKGDTLFSISKKLAISVPKLAELNQLSAPYAIQVGQVLNVGHKLTPTNHQKPVNNDASSGDAQVVTSAISQTETAPPPKAEAIPKTPATEKVTQPDSSVELEAITDQSLQWQWPLRGKITASYDGQGNKGINIAGTAGQTVVASAAGRVIYSGLDIRATGKLVIIKHNSNYLSVYAHQGNSWLKEGMMVAAGEKVATLPNTPGTASSLHFEIRQKGKPIDPITLLPN